MNSNTFFIMQNGRTPLFAAAGRGSLEVVTKLLKSGADVHVRDKVRTFFLSNYILGCIAPKSFSVFELTCAVFVKFKSLL